MRGNYKTRFCGGQSLTAVEGNASVYQVNPVNGITAEGGAGFLWAWGPNFDQKGGGREGEGYVICCVDWNKGALKNIPAKKKTSHDAIQNL